MASGPSTHGRESNLTGDERPFRILVICTGNRARSQMAQGWLRHLGGPAVEVESAGTSPRGVHPLAIRAMAEVGVDISGHPSDHVDRFVDQDFDLVLTVCDSARESCPVFPGAGRVLHHSFQDPDQPGLEEQDLYDLFKSVRDEIGAFSRALLAQEIGN